MLGVKPSYRTGFAQWRGVSEYLQSWNGLVGAWPFFLGATGNKVFDLSGNGNDGTLTGGDVTWTSGKFGSALNFPGTTGDYVDCGNIIMPTIAATWSIWFNTDSISGVNKTLISKWNHGVSATFMIERDDDDINVFIADAVDDTGNNRWLGTGNEIAVGKSYHLIVVYNGAGTTNADRLKLYINGIQSTSGGFGGTIPASLIISSESFQIGNTTSLDRPFDGKIDNVSFYKRALSASERDILHQITRRYAS